MSILKCIDISVSKGNTGNRDGRSRVPPVAGACSNVPTGGVMTGGLRTQLPTLTELRAVSLAFRRRLEEKGLDVGGVFEP